MPTLNYDTSGIELVFLNPNRSSTSTLADRRTVVQFCYGSSIQFCVKSHQSSDRLLAYYYISYKFVETNVFYSVDSVSVAGMLRNENVFRSILNENKLTLSATESRAHSLCCCKKRRGWKGETPDYVVHRISMSRPSVVGVYATYVNIPKCKVYSP